MIADDERSPGDYRLVQVSHKTKISKCVLLSLSLLENDDQLPLCLHTLPPPQSSTEEIEKIITSSKRNPDKNGVGKLISIVEIIKREFAGDKKPGDLKRRKLNDDDHQRSPKKSSRGQLHQYNQYGSLESLISDRLENHPERIDPVERKAIELAAQEKILKEFMDEERKRPRQSHTPFMKIYLSRTPIPSLANHTIISYQAPPTSDFGTKTMESNASNLTETKTEVKHDVLKDESMLAPI